MKQSYSKQNPESIQHLFNSIASRYDLANSIMSWHMHTLWNKKLIKKTLQDTPENILDLCAGTGEIAEHLLKNATNNPKITLVDFSKEMIEVAKKRPLLKPCQFLIENVETLPFPDSSFDAISCAYGIRNVLNRKKCFSEALRVLQPGKSFHILELTKPKSRFFQFFHKLYTRFFLPVVGKIFCRNKKAYQYLCQSIQQFIPPETIASELKETGFTNIEVTALFFGTAHIIKAEK